MWSPGNYIEQEELGRGGFGVVRKCWDKDALRFFVAKPTLLDGIEALKIAENEVARLKDLSHPRIIGYFGYKHDQNTLIIFMEYMPAGSLRQVINKQKTPLTEKTTKLLIEQILEGLSYIHEKGIVHSDLKCDNLLIDGAGNLKLGDFGIAIQKSFDTAMKTKFIHTAMGGGTLYWMAPEIINETGASTRRSDMWSLGCTVIEMLTGQPPYGAMGSAAFISAIYTKMLTYDPKELVPSVSSQMKKFLSCLLQFVPDDRPHTGARATAIFQQKFFSD